MLALVTAAAARPAAQDPQEIFDRALADVQSRRLDASVAGFDAVAGSAPAYAPHLWPRGVARYQVGRYEECRRQFESHRTMNPNDVENADELRSIPVWKAHQMSGDRTGTWSLHVTRNWRLTFRIDAADNEILDVNHEDYH